MFLKSSALINCIEACDNDAHFSYEGDAEAVENIAEMFSNEAIYDW